MLTSAVLENGFTEEIQFGNVIIQAILALLCHILIPVPDNWIPFIPVQKEVAAGDIAREIRLQRARMPQGTRALSRILKETQPVYLIEEVPRAGVIIKEFSKSRLAEWLNLFMGRQAKTSWPG